MTNRKKTESGTGKGGAKKTLLRSLIRLFLILSIWGLFVGALVVAWFSYDLPSVSRLADTARRPNITVLAQDGTRIAVVGDYYAKAVDSEKLPQHVIQAFTATEDRRFFDHFGLDVFGIVRAFIKNTMAGRVVQGGSTITQQLAKNFLLTEGLYTYQDRSLRRKVQEFIFAVWLEQKFSKHQIMTIYLNRVYFGSGAFGLGAAAKQYFNKEARHLNLYEAALLAGLLKAPSKFSPLNSPKESAKRTQQVLTAMVDAGYITSAERDKWRSVPKASLPHNHGNLFARYFVDWVVETIPSMIGNIMEDLIVSTTLDVEMQKKAEEAIRTSIDDEGALLNVTQGALLAMTPSGSVRAMVGGYSYGQSQFNRAVQAQRQSGSAFKLFVFLAALEAGMDINRRIVDGPITLGKWSPKNYGWTAKGDVSMAEGFAYSINTVSVRLARYVGVQNVIAVANRLGVYTPQPSDLTIALGSGDVTLLEMTGAFATVAREGYPVDPYAIIEIKTRRGKTLYREPAQYHERVLSLDVAQKMDLLLRAVMDYGTGRNVHLEGVPCAGKTGTTQNYNDAWFVGYTDRLVAGVWVGNDDNALMKKVTGARLPGKIWKRFMQSVS